jgi:hypothetical protein
MFTIPKSPGWSLLGTLEGLFAGHPASFIGGSQSHAAEREAQEALDRMPAHLRDDLGLSPTPRPAPEHPALTRARNRASRWGS